MWVRTVVAVFIVTGTVWGQEASQPPLEVTYKLSGKKLALSGSVEMPDGTILNLQIQREPEMLLCGRVDSRIEPSVQQGAQSQGAVVEKRRFQTTLDLMGQGFYRIAIMYSQFAQRDEEVLKVLGTRYTDWGREIHATLLDAPNIVRLLRDERGRFLEIIHQMPPIANAIEEMFKQPKDRRDFAPMREKIDALDKKVKALEEVSFYGATWGAIIEGLQRMRQCSPDTLSFELPPGMTREHVEAEMGEMPMGFSDETDLESVRVFINRASRCADRERFLVPLRGALSAWENAVRTFQAKEATDVTIDGVKQEWDQSAAIVRENCSVIESELPDEKKRTAAEELLATWCAQCVELMGKMDDFLTKRRAARVLSKEEQGVLDTKDYKETRAAFEVLNNALRRVPSK